MRIFTKNSKVLAEIALKHNLYQSVNWCLYGMLEDATIDDSIKVALCMDSGIIKGVALFDANNFCGNYNATLQIFIKPKYRENGIGTKLIKKIISTISDENISKIMTGEGVIGSSLFWRKMINDGIIPKNSFMYDNEFSFDE